MLFKLADFKFIPSRHLYTCTRHTFIVMLDHKQCSKLDVGTQVHGLMLVGTERILELTLVQFDLHFTDDKAKQRDMVILQNQTY